jgi:hypothetical protein
MSPLARLFDWLRDHPWRGFAGALSFWVLGAVGIDVVDSLTAWNPDGQVTELIGGLLGLPLTAVAVVVLFQHLERAQLQPVLNRRRQAARDALNLVSPEIVMAYLGSRAYDDLERAASASTHRESSTAPLLMSSRRVSNAAERLDAVSEQLAALASYQPETEQGETEHAKGGGTSSGVVVPRPQKIPKDRIEFHTNLKWYRDGLDPEQFRYSRAAPPQIRLNELLNRRDHLRLVLDDVRQLSTDPEEIATVDRVLSAMEQWSLDISSQSLSLFSSPKGLHELYNDLAWSIVEPDSFIRMRSWKEVQDIEAHFRRAAQLLRVIDAVDGDEQSADRAGG